MTKLNKAILQLDTKPCEEDKHLCAAFAAADPEVGDIVTKARALGFSWLAIIQLLIQYGPQFVSILQAIIAALNTTPPVPAGPVTFDAKNPYA